MRSEYRQLGPVTVLYVREMGSYPLASARAWGRLLNWLELKRARRTVRTCIGVLRDNPRQSDPDLLRYDACVGIVGDLCEDPPSGVLRQVLQGGTYAVHNHVGPHGEIGSKLSLLHSDLLPRRGMQVDYDRSFITIFLNDPTVTPEIHRRTNLCVPVLPVLMPAASNDLEQPALHGWGTRATR